MFVYEGHNRVPFNSICDCNFGRKVIFTYKNKIDANNIIEELGKALAIHRQNADEIDYLERYYEGDAPILYRNKDVRPEVNNKVHINLSYPLVEMKTSEMAGEPIQYVLHGTDEKKSEQIAQLNTIMEGESKQESDIELCRWRSICGTSYRFIGKDDGKGSFYDETPFFIDVPDPRYTFVAYHQNKKPAFSCQIQKDEEGKRVYYLFTNSEWFKTDGKDILESGLNGNRAIPVIEYPNNNRRLSDIEITISINDVIDTLASDRVNGIEQFVASWIKFVNCEIDEELFAKMRQAGALTVKSNNGSENKADVDIITQELNQTEGQVVMDDLFNKFLVIQGLANREGNTGGDTAGAVELRNGHYDAEKRAELSEPIFKKAERQFIMIALNQLRIDRGFTLKASDIEIKISRSKMDNMMTKAEVLQMLLSSGINSSRAIKTVGLFSDPEQVYAESKKRMEILYPETQEAEVNETIKENVTVEDNADV